MAWRPPAGVARGIAARDDGGVLLAPNPWPWLALAGGLRIAGGLAAVWTQPDRALDAARGFAESGGAAALEKSVMTFDRSWVLALAWIPLAWGYFEYRRTTRKLGLALKVATFTLILLALAQPRLSISTTKVAVGVLVDTSASVSPRDLERASKIASDLDDARGSNALRVIPFARSTRMADLTEDQKPWKLRLTSGQRRTFDRSGSGGSRGDQFPALRNAAAAGIDFGRQGKQRQHRARGMAGAAGGNSDRHVCDGRARPAGAAAGIRESADECVYRGAVRNRSGGVGAGKDASGGGAISGRPVIWARRR